MVDNIELPEYKIFIFKVCMIKSKKQSYSITEVICLSEQLYGFLASMVFGLTFLFFSLDYLLFTYEQTIYTFFVRLSVCNTERKC